jgi:AcrR family transcriptional regulator
VRNSTDAEFSAQGGRSGRRPGESGTRAAIAASASRLFAARGYDRTSLRAIAADAGVDPALVTHYFGSKQRLLIEVASPPIDPKLVVAQVVEGDPDGAGERLARLVLGVLEDPEGRERITAMVRAAASEPEAAVLMRDMIVAELYGPMTAALGGDRSEFRANLVGSQVVGLVMARYVVAIEPIASAPVEEVVAAIAPTLQRYLMGPLI